MDRNKLRQFGFELKQEREYRNLKLADISKRTKISLKFLEAIESGNFEFLPNPYVRYFVKSYIEQLGGHTEKYYRKFNELIRVQKRPHEDNGRQKAVTPPPAQKNEFRENIEKTFKQVREQHLSLVISSAFLLVLIIFLLVFNSDESNGNMQASDRNKQVSGQDSQLASFSSFVPAKKDLELNLVAAERTWMQIAVDDSAAQEFIFERGDTMTWEAKQKFLIRVGNGAGVRLYLNGNDLGKLGQRMEVINFVLTKDGIQEKRL
ncbi:DUF4115 domain-containing protein [candidate division KSB1 bacterium]|nr:DUF4115 domain-containing protein [candidate division KSB1 bacterium]